ncbi:MurR/RpiR family transcriptional regulator [Paenibacillus eucommiae]|uniref:DNA-binding MurR/RpiR family transcriptional regulator n=1 Tax=Paenibacillus eucommiae TaxID=1355755 RepID=A0ABS4J4T0_9BACL|nr:MurR/RpiR family transcriptional regulator [Paenibacillus eucommiae]MBP1993794.1 DNA-binding MurR/RpiR family transcriptional regulator [Paenibacillus eucommiae]
METMNDLVRKKYDELTASMKLVAKFVLEQPEQVALHTAKEIGGQSGTSETTVIRFSLALGFSGYSMLQEEIRKTLLMPKERENPLRKFSDLPQQSAGDSRFLSRFILEQDMAYMNKTIEELAPEVLEKAVDSIIAARKIIIVGLRASHAAAFWLTSTLNIMRGNAVLYRGAVDDANYLITDLDKDCLVIALSFPRYSLETLNFVLAAKARSANILAISDDELSPLGSKADVFIKVSTPQPATLKGMAVLFTLLNVLIAEVTAKDHTNIQRRIDAYNTTTEQFFAFVEDGK